MTTSIVASGPYALRFTTQERTNVNDEWKTAGSVEYPAAENGRQEITISSTSRVIIEEYTPAPSEHDEQAEIDRVTASNEEWKEQQKTEEEINEEQNNLDDENKDKE